MLSSSCRVVIKSYQRTDYYGILVEGQTTHYFKIEGTSFLFLKSITSPSLNKPLGIIITATNLFYSHSMNEVGDRSSPKMRLFVLKVALDGDSLSYSCVSTQPGSISFQSQPALVFTFNQLATYLGIVTLATEDSSTFAFFTTVVNDQEYPRMMN